jgi:hypothetical protein
MEDKAADKSAGVVAVLVGLIAAVNVAAFQPTRRKVRCNRPARVFGGEADFRCHF